MAADPLRAAARLAETLGDSAVVVGGLAVAAWGHVRATKDIDFLCRLEPGDIVGRLARAGINAAIRRGDVPGGDIPWVVEGTVEGVPFQVLPPLVEWHRVHALPVREAVTLPVVDLPDLLRLKLQAGGQRDLWDVSKLLRVHPERTEETRVLARSLGVLDSLDRWIADPRLD